MSRTLEKRLMLDYTLLNPRQRKCVECPGNIHIPLNVEGRICSERNCNRLAVQGNLYRGAPQYLCAECLDLLRSLI